MILNSVFFAFNGYIGIDDRMILGLFMLCLVYAVYGLYGRFRHDQHTFRGEVSDRVSVSVKDGLAHKIVSEYHEQAKKSKVLRQRGVFNG